MNELKDGKGFLKEKMEGFRVQPPEEVWNAVSSQLGHGGRRRILLISLATAATIALAVTIGLNIYGPSVLKEMPVAKVPADPSGEDAPVLADKDPDQSRQPGPETGESPSEPLSGLEAKVAEALDELRPAASEPAARVVAENIPPSVPVNPDQEGKPPVMPDETEADPQEVADVPPDNALARLPSEKEEEKEVSPRDGNSGLMEGEAALDEPVSAQGAPARERGGLVLGASASPLYSFRDAETQFIDPSHPGESGTVAFSGGVQVGYRTSGRLAIESGLYFNRMGINIGARGIQVLGNEVDMAPIPAGEYDMSRVVALTNTVGNIVSETGDIYVNNYLLESKRDDYGTDAESVTGRSADEGIRQHLEYLEIPLNVRYTVIDRSIKVHLLGGLSTNLLVNNYVSMETADGPREIGYMTNLRTLNYSGNAGIGFSFHFLNDFRLSLEPRFRYFLHSVNDASLPSTRPYTFGLYTGFSYLF